MPASTTYDVKIAMMLEDKATRGLSHMQGQLRRTQRETARMQRNLQSMSSGNLMAKAFGLGAGIFTIRKAASALFDFNKTIDMAQASFTGLLQMNMGGDMMTNFKRAGRLVNMFIDDAKRSVASTDDFIRMGENIVGPLTQVGASLTDIREITKGAVTAAQAFGINANVAGMDIQQAIQGRMTLRDRLPKLLGLDPESWNKMARKNPQEALQRLKSILGQSALKNMAEMQANTFTGQWRKLKDNLTITLGKVGRPLMKAMADEFSRISKWVDANPDKVNAFTRELASALTTAFSAMKSAMSFLWRNREMLLLVAKAFLAFKAVRGVTNLVGGAIGNILQFGQSLSGANAGLNTFSGKLGSLGNKLGLLGAAGVAGWEIGKEISNSIWDELPDWEIMSAAEAIERQRYGVSATAPQSEFLAAKDKQAKAVELMGGVAWGRAGAAEDMTAKLGLGAGKEATLGAVRRASSMASATAYGKSLQQGVNMVAEAARIQYMNQNKYISLAAARADTEKMGLEQLLALAEQFKASSNGALLAGQPVVNAIRFMQGLLSVEGGGTPGDKQPGGPPTNINVQMKVEVKSDDPDRFVMDLGKAFEMAVKSPSSAFATFREG